MDTDYRVTLLENFVYGDECLEGLNFVSEDGLYFEGGSYRCGQVVVPGIDNAFCVWSERWLACVDEAAPSAE